MSIPSNDSIRKIHPFPFSLHSQAEPGIFDNDYFLRMQQNPAVRINLKALAMGDGWVRTWFIQKWPWKVDPYYQTGSYADFLYENGLINGVERDIASVTYQAYKGLIDAEAWLAADEVLSQVSWLFTSKIGNALLESLVLAAGNVDVYDIRYIGGDPTDPLGDALGDYLNVIGFHFWIDFSARWC